MATGGRVSTVAAGGRRPLRAAKRIAVGAALVVALAVTAAAPGGATVPAGGGGTDECRVVTAVNDRCPVWARTTDNPDGHLYRSDQMWLAPVPYEDSAAVVLSGDGRRLYATGSTWTLRGGNPEYDILTTAYDASTGAVLWQRQWNSVNGAWDTGTGIALAADGSVVYVVGNDGSAEGGALVLGYDSATGALQWAARTSGTAAQVEARLDADRIYAAGVFEGEQWVGAFRPSTASWLWTRTYPGDAPLVHDLAVAPAGDRLYVTGRVTVYDGGDVERRLASFAVATGTGAEPAGQLQWQSIWPRAYYSYGRDIAVSNDGQRVFVTGPMIVGDDPYGVRLPERYVTLGYEAASGAVVWEAFFDGFSPVSRGQNIPHALAVNPVTDEVYVTGVATGTTELSLDVGTVAYDGQSGAQRWTARYGVPGMASRGHTVTVSADGRRVLVTGSSGPVEPAYELAPGVAPYRYASSSIPAEEAGDLATLVYDATTGAAEWVARFNHDAGHTVIGRSVVIDDAAGRFYVGGMIGGAAPVDLAVPQRPAVNLYDTLVLAYSFGAATAR